MTTAQLTAVVNGGAPQTGPITVNPSDVVQLGAGNTVGIQHFRFEFYSYPQDPTTWSTPAGWTLDGSSKKIYWEGATPNPPAITWPDFASNLWGLWLPALIVNGGIGTPPVASLTDASMAIEVIPAGGMRDLGWGEAQQRDAWKGYVRFLQKNLRLLQGVSAFNATELDITSGTVVVGAGGLSPNTSDTIAFTTTDGAMHTVRIYPMPAQSGMDLAFSCFARNTGATGGAQGDSYGFDMRSRWKKGLVGAAAVAVGAAATRFNNDGDAGENAITAQVIVNGTSGVVLQVQGVAGHTLAWSLTPSAAQRL